jgi:type 1 glutamine amidotransferase
MNPPFRLRVAICCAALLAASIGTTPTRADADVKPVRALLVIGGCCHDYKKQKELLTKGVSARADVQWAVAFDPSDRTDHPNPIYEKDDWAKGFDVVVHDECSADVKDPKVVERILKPHKAGLPGVVLHCGMHSYRSEGFPKSTPWFDFTGLASTGHGAQAPVEVRYTDKESPITTGLSGWKTIDEELYNNSAGQLLDTAQPLAKGAQTRQAKNGERTAEAVVVWTNKYNGKTKVFATTLGHNNGTVADPRYLDLVARGLLWSVGKLDAAHLKPAAKVLLDAPKE